ncbi:hypothetical protein IRP62_07085 [Clostridium botulinum]|nr:MULTISPECIES: hypothetical protein [Clostridium]KGM94297.1 hypothetical protein Z956_08150 [Clostridium botulinum D str. CCUG 7971]KOC51108.1 hypothetical protein ADU88_00620 [Clostridium botulinum]NFO98889.1 hypothetical protein [Clostridium botulinum]NFU56698.1 hypothetical protein [Clostridium botulinum]NFV18478.1 hypothetical protein [Clostridium botulinum]
MQINPSILNAKYIYLDWNVIKYMKEPRLDKGDLDNRFKDMIFRLKGKYKMPYSMAHIKDRANNYKSEYYDKVKEDFDFAETINDMLCLGIHDASPVIVQESMMKCFNDYITEPEKKLSIKDEDMICSFNVDMTRMDISHPMYDFFKSHGGRYSAQNMGIFLKEMYASIFEDVSRYKILREYIKKMDLKNNFNQAYSLGEKIMLDRLLYHMFSFLDSFKDDEETLIKKWPKIAEKWFSLNNEYVGSDLLLIQGYTLLDMHPLFNDKLKKGKNTLDNIIRDGNHCFYASKGQYFVSEDAYTRKKTAFLYAAYDIKTKVVSEAEFLNYFDF